tara:strand:+ start:164 stop:571 length:408 start_codon:yes stop_codon:yes gene_type:complete
MADATAYYQRQHSGLGSVGSYQVSGTPFMTGSTITGTQEVSVTFPGVTRSITVINKDAGNDDIRVHFQSKDTARTIAGLHYITLGELNSSVTMNVKCKTLYLSAPSGDATFELFAELTGINPQAMFPLTGSGIDA